MSCQENHPDFCGEVTWEKLAFDLIALPAVIQIGLTFSMIPISRYWSAHSKSWLVTTVRHIVGDEELKIFRYPRFLMGVFLMEIILSMWFFWSWAIRTYSHEVSDFYGIVDKVFCLFFIGAYVMNAARNNFTVRFALRPSPIITVLTVVPTFFRNTTSTNLWFSFGYLRASNAVIAVNKIELMGALQDVGDVSRMYIRLSLRTFALVACLVGTTFVLEVLGDPSALKDEFIETNMGGLSVVQLTYWIFTTISTVGYGDYAPKTVLCRLFIIAAIVVGVCFFTEEINEVVRVNSMVMSGKGRYHTRRGLDHVVLIGGGVSQFSSVMQSLMNEVFAAEQERWPDLLIMAAAEEPELLRQAIRSMPKNKRQHVRYYMGDPTDPEDMRRVRMDEADLVIIIPSLLALDMDSEDEANILLGMAVTNCYRDVNMRLMLLRSTNKKVAVQVGFSPSRCFSINEQKSGLFALACSCRGFSSMITHFLMADDPEENVRRLFNRRGKTKQGPTWVEEYKEARRFHIGGFMLNSRFAGISFSQFAILSTKRNITPIAVQIDGKLHLAPEHALEEGQIIFALVRNAEDVNEFKEPKSNWRETFKERQTNAQERAKRSFFKKHRSITQSLMERSDKMQRALSINLDNALDSKSNPPSRQVSPQLQRPGSPQIQRQVSPQLQRTISTNSNGLPQRQVSTSSVKTGEEKQQDISRKAHYIEAQGHSIAEAGGHFILVLMQGAPWPQIHVYLSTLRASHLPFHIPILVLISQPFPPQEQLVGMFEGFPRTAYLRAAGKITHDDVRMCGMASARCIALLAGNADRKHISDRRMVDGAGVTLLSCIEGEIKDSNSPSVPVFLELHHQESVRFLSPFFHPDHSIHGSQDDKFDPTESFTNHARFANGNIFTASCFGATMARSFNMPGIVELMEAITLGTTNSQTSFPWQVKCPEGFAEKSYGELSQHFLENYNAVCLGLFRLCFSEGDVDGPRFVMTSPDQEVQLRDHDWCFVLGNSAFGKLCYTKNMLVGADSAPSADEPEEFSPLLKETGAIIEDDPKLESPNNNANIDIWQDAHTSLRDIAGECEARLPQLRTPTGGVHHTDMTQKLLALPPAMESNSARPRPKAEPIDANCRLTNCQICQT